MKKKMKRLFAFLLASVMMFSTLSLTAAAEGEEYLMFLAYGGEYTEGAWDMCWANEEGNASGIEATTATFKAGDTVTIGLKMPQAATYTWYMAPTIVAENVTSLSYTIDSVTIDGKEILDTIDLSLGEDDWWYEGTGNYTNEQTIRLKGGYNEWANKYIAESPVGFTEIMYTITVSEIVTGAAAGGGAVPAGADEEFPMFMAFGGDRAESNDWGLAYYGEGNEGNSADIVATNAVAKVGDTVTIGLTMPSAAVYTWFMAPVVVAEGVTSVGYTIDSITIDGTDVLADVDLAAGDAWWYEGTGNYSNEQSIRLAGGYNEWGTKYMATAPAGFTEIMYTITLTEVMYGGGAGPVESTESYPAFIAIGADKEAGDWAYSYAGEETPVAGITAVNGELKSGETTTISLSFETPVVYTWYMAPCFVVPDSAAIDASSTFDVKVFLDGTEVTPDFAAGDAFWAEGTGSYAQEQCVRIAGGYNEWGTKYIAESPAGFSEIKYEITPHIYVAAATEEAPQNEFDPNGTYHAYIGVQTPTWIFRNSWDDATYGKDSGCFDQMGFIDGDWLPQGGTFTDVEITGNGTYTVKVEGYDFSGNFQDAPILGADGLFNLLFVSTDLPVNDAVVISNVVLKMDGSVISEQADAFLDADSKEVQKVLLANIWNNEITALPYYAAPKQSIEISFDVSGFANDAVVAEPEAPVATEAPAAEPTEAPAATDAPKATTAPVSAPAEEEGGSNTGIIIGVVVVAAIAAIGGGVYASKKKKSN
ncbi:MAG: hypothetical protein IJX63_09960 [Lachnospiraceae bacterium]|nr:hypothetical protein [Lachnospiraceae bacterium]